jgi:hypothetical protein
MHFAKKLLWLSVFLAACSVLHSSTSQALQSEWTLHQPGGETLCARGTPYSFYSREGSNDDVLVYFEGGGGCWNADTCIPGSGAFDDEVDPNDEYDNPGLQPYGLLNLHDPQNPFKDSDILFIPYCTGDGHLGDADVTYTPLDGPSFEIHHNGYQNASAALDWLYENYPAPPSITVIGCSGGTVGSFMHTPHIAQHYQDTGHSEVRIAQLSDSGGFGPKETSGFLPTWNARASVPTWIESLQDISNDDLDLTTLTLEIGKTYPDVIFAMFNSSHDDVLTQYMKLAGLDYDFNALLLETVINLGIELPNFRAFVGWGDIHCLTPRGEFYTYMTNGITFRDWVAALANGEDLENVFCEDCSTPQFR